MTEPNQFEVATLGGGCFWCLEAIYNELKGIIKVESGYAGGIVPNPTYNHVCTGTTGHAEVIQITYNPNIIIFKEILQIFFTMHDPTTLNRQGNDVGTQYRSIILYHNQNQKQTTEQIINEITQEKIWNNPIVTQIEPYQRFYKAEDDHQEYYKKNPEQYYCKIIIAPKIAKLRKQYFEKLKKE
ncbi:peptide-methionine (S)-S-oxide reductase [Candidatus Bathyarchaeota archaeon RBG_13_38_9]|nr:MAG: peptide-methionine (S)-S-oxide reductase [Candidatus Bathyarchaeota archaeon RBG_13_38_9]